MWNWWMCIPGKDCRMNMTTNGMAPGSVASLCMCLCVLLICPGTDSGEVQVKVLDTDNFSVDCSDMPSSNHRFGWYLEGGTPLADVTGFYIDEHTINCNNLKGRLPANSTGLAFRIYCLLVPTHTLMNILVLVRISTMEFGQGAVDNVMKSDKTFRQTCNEKDPRNSSQYTWFVAEGNRSDIDIFDMNMNTMSICNMKKISNRVLSVQCQHMRPDTTMRRINIIFLNRIMTFGDTFDKVTKCPICPGSYPKLSCQGLISEPVRECQWRRYNNSLNEFPTAELQLKSLEEGLYQCKCRVIPSKMRHLMDFNVSRHNATDCQMNSFTCTYMQILSTYQENQNQTAERQIDANSIGPSVIFAMILVVLILLAVFVGLRARTVRNTARQKHEGETGSAENNEVETRNLNSET